MKFIPTITVIGIRILLLLSTSSNLFSHPSSGIVVNEIGEVLFVHSSRGLAKIQPDGKLTYIHQSTGGHWLCLDPQGHFSHTQPKHFLRVTPAGHRPAIIFADGGAPIAVATDGQLYYGSGWGGGHEHEPGAATISRLSPDGSITAFAPKLKEELSRQRAGVTGLAAGPDGAIYVASAVGIFKVAKDGSVKTFVERPELKDCDPNPPPDGLPGFQGMAVSINGTVYAAATGCRLVIKISPEGTVQTVLKSEPPWSPTAVALHHDNLYILEWTNPNGGPQDGWRARVRKLAPDQTITTLITIPENVPVNRRP
ncbi:MAG TPA: hypothetical protein VK633_00835 [Verrucomicrobiae bacterium]|nr:hypothetical protein [Verrucomicrobiae bacterium]